jgi:hypothetical protein
MKDLQVATFRLLAAVLAGWALIVLAGAFVVVITARATSAEASSLDVTSRTPSSPRAPDGANAPDPKAARSPAQKLSNSLRSPEPI